MPARLCLSHRCVLLALLLPVACSSGNDAIDPDGSTFDAVAPEEVVTLAGTEPFWNVRIAEGEAVWMTPGNPGGTRFAITRFAGNNGLGFSGTLNDQPFNATLTPGDCSDGMSNRTFPFVTTIALGGETLMGCGYTTGQPFTGDEAP